MRYSNAKIPMIAAAILCATLSAQAGASDFTDTADHTEQDAERTLDEVTTLGQRFDPNAPQTGELLIRPVLAARRRNESTVTGFELVFAAVEIAENGSLLPYTDKPRERFRLKGVTPTLQERGRIRSTVAPETYPVSSFNLPGGTYALSEVHYTFRKIVRSNRLSEDGNILSIPETRPDRTSFCLSERSFIFDVVNGRVSYLGTVALADLPSNPLRNRHHEPILGIDQNLSIPGVASKVDAGVTLVDLADTSFDSEAGICTNTRFNVAGWTPRE
ncbi:MAG: hypothetical protein ABJG15_07265 [Hyphomonadaceae bacterium]